MYAEQPFELIYGSWETGGSAVTRTVDVCVRTLHQAVLEHGQAVMAIPGGRSITRVLQALQHDPRVPWEMIQLFWVDERWVPLENSESNFSAAWEPVLQPLIEAGRMHQDQIHPFRYRSDLPDGGVGLYQSEFRHSTSESNERFDLVLLGVGEDGHCASLFPRHPALEHDEYGFIAVDNSPKPPPQRVSASRSMIVAARCAVLLFFGEGKRTALERFRDDEVEIEACPCKLGLHAAHTAVVTDLD